jgi:hypothetical protein
VSRRLAVGIAGFIVALVSVGALKTNGQPHAPLVVLAAALVAGAVVAVVVAKRR